MGCRASLKLFHIIFLVLVIHLNQMIELDYSLLMNYQKQLIYTNVM